MRYKLLGRSGLRVSELCLGTMTFGEDWGWGASRDECTPHLRALRRGGRQLHRHRQSLHRRHQRADRRRAGCRRARPLRAATKYTLSTRPDDPNGGGNHRKNLVQSLEASLRRLGTDYLDVYWLHVWDVSRPSRGRCAALDDLVRAGKVLYVGISDTPAWVVAAGQHPGRAARLEPLRRPAGALQPGRAHPRAGAAAHGPSLGLTVTSWGPLGGGLLTGRYGTDRQGPTGHPPCRPHRHPRRRQDPQRSGPGHRGCGQRDRRRARRHRDPGRHRLGARPAGAVGDRPHPRRSAAASSSRTTSGRSSSS